MVRGSVRIWARLHCIPRLSTCQGHKTKTGTAASTNPVLPVDLNIHACRLTGGMDALMYLASGGLLTPLHALSSN